MFLKMTKFDTDRVNIDRAILGGVKSAQDDGVTLYDYLRFQCLFASMPT